MAGAADGGEVLTLREVAERLGVHYMTAYRYVRTGKLPAYQVGAEWRVAAADLAEIKAVGQVPAARGRARPERYRSRLIPRLLDGDEPGAWAIIESALVAGTEPGQIYLTVLAPAMREIGEGWKVGTVGVAEEHRAAAVATRIIGRLGPSFSRRGRSRGTVVIGAAPGDHHALPVAMLRDVLRGAGYAVVDLGADVPLKSFVAAAESASHLVACAVGLANSEVELGAIEVVEALRAVRPTLPVFVGGAAVRDAEHAAQLGANAFGADAAAVCDALSDLC